LGKNGQRVTLLTDVRRGDLTGASTASLATRLLKHVAATPEAYEVAVLDAGFKVKAVQALSSFTTHATRALGCLYQARWSIEQVPLVVKPTLEGIGDRPLAKGSLGTSPSETVKSGLKRAQNIIRWKV
jgi:hypothetical protein